MEKWEIALQKFLKKWENKKEVVGALVCGSYITGNPSKHSDIDVHLILNSKTKWRQRGNEIIDGILIEYFANPARTHFEYSESDYKQRRKSNAHMFCSGKILFDKTGELKKLIQDSKKNLVRKFPKQNRISVEISKYGLWDMMDNLEEIFESNGDEFVFVYNVFLYKLFDQYSAFLRFDSILVNKLKRFLTNEQDKKKYHIAHFPDQTFVRIFVKAMETKDKKNMMSEYKKLTNHVLVKMGGFEIDGWKIRSPAE